MSLEIILTLAIFIFTLVMLLLNRFRSDLVALVILLALGLSGVVEAQKVFSGFSSSAVITILGISMISVSLQQTGATNSIGRILHRIGGNNESLLILLVTLTGAFLSLFMNNMAAVGVLLPAVMTLSRKGRVSPSRLLIPLAFGTILGGMATLLTTSNIIVSGALKDAGFPAFGLLDYFPVGGLVAGLGILYLVILGKRLLPGNKKANRDSEGLEFADRLIQLYQVDENVHQVSFLPGSPLVNLSIKDGNWQKDLGLNVLAIIRRKIPIFTPEPEIILLPNDILVASGVIQSELLANYQLQCGPVDYRSLRFSDESNPLAEILISPHSRLIGKSIKEIKFRDLYSLNVVGVWRNGKPLLTCYSDLHLQFGDALLVQGLTTHIHSLQQNHDLVLLQEDPDAVLFPRKGLISTVITLATLTVAAIGILPVSLVVLGGAVLLILTGCMNMNDAFRGIEWKAIFLIAGLWPLSIAFQETGLASLLVSSLINLVGSSNPVLLGGIMILVSMLLTIIMSGQVSAIVMIPLALATAQNLGVDPRPFAMAVAMGCSLAFISPLGHPVNIMVMNPGGYTFRDYFKVGFPLTLIAFVMILVGIRLFWGL